MSNNGYLPSTTDTSVGTNSNDAGVRARDVNQENAAYRSAGTDGTQSNKGGVTRVQMHAPEPGLVHIEGIGWTSEEAAKAAGLYDESTDLVPYAEDKTELVEQPQEAPEVEPGVDQKLADAANAHLDHLQDELGDEAFIALANAAVELDPDAIDAVGGNDSPIVQSYIHRGLSWANSIGLENNDMTDYLDDADQTAARKAVVLGQTDEFMRLAHKALARKRGY